MKQTEFNSLLEKCHVARKKYEDEPHYDLMPSTVHLNGVVIRKVYNLHVIDGATQVTLWVNDHISIALEDVWELKISTWEGYYKYERDGDF